MRIFICDDSEHDLEFYSNKIRAAALKYGKMLELSRFRSGEELLFHLSYETEEIDAIFLDIGMSGIDGIIVAERLQELDFDGLIIFLTRSKKHFLPAFDVGAFNYIVKKETTQERFESVFRKVVKYIDEKETEYILVRGGGEYRRVDVKSIHYFEIQKRIVTVFYKDKQFEFFSTMDKIESQLHGKGFLRIHRAFLVALRSIETASYDTLYLKNGAAVPVGRTYQKRVQKYLKDHLR